MTRTPTFLVQLETKPELRQLPDSPLSRPGARRAMALSVVDQETSKKVVQVMLGSSNPDDLRMPGTVGTTDRPGQFLELAGKELARHIYANNIDQWTLSPDESRRSSTVHLRGLVDRSVESSSPKRPDYTVTHLAAHQEDIEPPPSMEIIRRINQETIKALEEMLLELGT